MPGSQQDSCATRRKERLRQLNDDLRRNGVGGRFMITQGIGTLPHAAVTAIIRAVRDFDEFGSDNDPYGEHDMGTLRVHGHQIFWKIDYYDEQSLFGSSEPSNPAVTTRVLTVMLAAEY